MKKYVVVSVLLGLLTAVALAGVPTASDREEAARPARANPPYPGAKMSSTSNPIEALPEVQALRVEQQAAQARGDEPGARAIECRIQQYYLDRTPQQRTVGYPVALPEPQGGLLDPAPDVVIHPNQVMGTGADYEPDGTMWAVCSPLDSSVRVYNSTDAGQTWNYFTGFGWSTPCQFGRVQIVVGIGDSNFVHIFALLPFQDGDLVDVMYLHDGTYAGWAAVKSGADTVGDFSVCRDNIDPYFLHGAATNMSRGGSGTVAILRSMDFGRTWAQTQTWADGSNPSISTGVANSVYYTAAYASWSQGTLALVYNRTYGGGDWAETDITPDTFPVTAPVVAAAFTVPDSEAVLWWAWHHQTPSGIEVTACYSTDGGLSFSTPAPPASIPAGVQSWVDLKNYRSTGNTYVNISYFSMETTRRIYRQFASAGSPGVWSDTVRINNAEAFRNRDLTPWLVYSPGGPGTGAGCVFRQYDSPYAFCFNSPWTTAVAEPVAPGPARSGLAPSIVRGVLLLPEARGEKREARSELLDAAGRRVMNLAPGANDVSRVAAGVYFVDAGVGEPAVRVVIQR
jgi:hypothetical protein